IIRRSSASRLAIPEQQQQPPTAAAVCPVCQRPGALGERCAVHDRFKVSPSDLREAPRAHLLGTMIEGKYAVLGLLGSGAVGTVYWGIQHPIGRRVAIKVLRSELTVGDDERERFLREARSLARMNNPQVVSCYDYGFTQTRVAYMALEFVEGVTLEHVLDTTELELPEAVWLIRRVLEAVAAFHRHDGSGVVHRDLKPGNIMVCRSGADAEVVKIIDFGLVRHLGDPSVQTLTHHGAILGTPLYMSPEQALGQDVAQASDVYAVGVMLYEMLCGVPPFRGETVMDVMLGHVQRRVPAIRNRRVPTRLKAFVLKCLAKEPTERYPDAMAALHALTDLALPEREPFTEAAPGEIHPLETLPGAIPLPETIALDVDEAFLARLRRTPESHGGQATAPGLHPYSDLASRWSALLGETWGMLWAWSTHPFSPQQTPSHVLPHVSPGPLRPTLQSWPKNEPSLSLGLMDTHAAQDGALGLRADPPICMELEPSEPEVGIALSASTPRLHSPHRDGLQGGGPLAAMVRALAWLGRWVVQGLLSHRLSQGLQRRTQALSTRPLRWTWVHRLRVRRPWLAFPIGLSTMLAEAMLRLSRRFAMEVRGHMAAWSSGHRRLGTHLASRFQAAGRHRRWSRRLWRRHSERLPELFARILMGLSLMASLAGLVGVVWLVQALWGWVSLG
ncbi:MAG: serine/threonine-protein kinase, partial [Myxococcota bacterium]